MGVSSPQRQRFFVALLAVTAVSFFLLNRSSHKETLKEVAPLGENVASLPVFYRDVWPDPNQLNIYQMETSRADTLPARFLCAVESFCSHNPTAVVWLLVTAPVLQDGSLQELQAVHRNLRVAYAQFDLLLQDTPLYDFYRSSQFWDTDFIVRQRSNFARLAVVYKSGGLYADTDILAIRPVLQLSNFFALQSDTVINSAVFHFQRGHPMLLRVMDYILAHYNGRAWGAQGPYAVTAAAKAAGCPSTLGEVQKTRPAGYVQPCSQRAADDATTIEQTNKTSAVCDWTLLEMASFYPVPWEDARSLFVSSVPGRSGQPVEEIFPESCGVHLSHKFTGDSPFERGSVAYKLASAACPLLFGRSGGLL